MTKDWMRSATMMNYTAFDLNCGCYSLKFEAELKKQFRRSARRIEKNSLKKFLTR